MLQERILISSLPQSLPSLHISNSIIGSYGVFTSKDLPEFICVEIAKGIIIPREIYLNSLHSTLAYGISPDKLILDQYTIGWSETQVCVPLGNIGMFNHSNDPNCDFIQIKDRDCVGVVTIKNVKAGDELTVSYGPVWFKQKDYVKQINL